MNLEGGGGVKYNSHEMIFFFAYELSTHLVNRLLWLQANERNGPAEEVEKFE